MVKAIVGANWGDEGKGKITDMLAEHSDIVVRFQGGANAGHTIINDYGRFALHILPSGSFYSHVTNVIGNGVALDVKKLVDELKDIQAQNAPAPNLMVSERVQLLMPYHVLQDTYEEERLGGKSFGSTKSGIAPFYSDKYAKIGIQLCDLFDEKRLMERLTAACEVKNVLFEHLYHKPPVDPKAIFDELNLKVPTTQTELLEVCKALKAGGYDPWAQWYADGASVDIEMRPVVWTEAIQNGDNDMFEKLMSGEKKVADYPYFAKGLEAWGARMGNWARNDATSNKQSDANEIFLSGQAGMLYQGTWNYGSIEDLKSDDFDYGFFFVPTDDSGSEPVMNVQVDQAFMVNPKAENADWAVKFMEFFLSEQMGTWSDATKQPCITGATTENTTDFLKTILDVKASGNTVGYGEFTVPFTSAYTAAYRKALTAYATYCCTGKTTDGVNSVESCIEYMQELFDEEFAQAGL